MDWVTLYPPDRQPTPGDIAGFIASPLWEELNRFLTENYQASPSYSYSICAGQPGWNVKYQKAGRSLCTLYPMPGFFIALVVIGTREEAEAALIEPLLDEYTKKLMESSASVAGARWLMIHVTTQSILEDVKRLVQLRRKIKTSNPPRC